jgi:hypothetical protein
MRPGNSLTWILRAVGVLAALAPLAMSAGCGGDNDDRPQQWSFIYPAIIEPSCATASCHSNYTREAGVNFGLSSDEAYFQLVARHFAAGLRAARGRHRSDLELGRRRRQAELARDDFFEAFIDVDKPPPRQARDLGSHPRRRAARGRA